MTRPFVAITMGDPAGIGPEIIVKALTNSDIYGYCKPVVIGETPILKQHSTGLEFNSVNHPGQGKYSHGTVDVIEIPGIGNDALTMGKVNGKCGKAAFAYIKKAVDLALSREVDSISTGPINKESLKAGKIDYIGHTEIIGDLCGVEDPLTMFEVHTLRVFFLSRHLSLRRACDVVTENRVFDYIKKCSRAMAQIGLSNEILAVAGLNPHCGEHGLFGNEEDISIEPAIQKAIKLGYRVVGPIGADSVFHQALKGKYGAVLSLYHDQGHIATKMLDFERTISLTLGLPFLRTSVDHGTAFDIAGKGKAQDGSMIEAIRLSAKYSALINR